MNDQCAKLGPILTSPIITSAPGELSTWAPMSGEMTSFTNGLALSDFDPVVADMYGETKALLIKDLACPTWG